jgi:hypothetical protein
VSGWRKWRQPGCKRDLNNRLSSFSFGSSDLRFFDASRQPVQLDIGCR